MAAVERQPRTSTTGISLAPLVAVVVTSSIGVGIFALTSDLANAAAPGPALLAWLIVGFGILMLSLSLNHLVLKKPELEGIFAYADAGFGHFSGFISGWGYWLSAWLGNVAFATVLMSAIGYFVPAFKGGQNMASIIGASIASWLLTYIVNRGIESATFLNAIVTVCKLIPLFAFIVFAIVMFNGKVFTAEFWGNLTTNLSSDTKNVSIWNQMRDCMMALMWVFVGIEGAVMLSSRAKRKTDAGKATLIGLISLIIIYLLASMLPYGYLSRTELTRLPEPAMVYIFSDMVGSWGGAFISIGLIISVLGSWLSWTMLPVETTQLMAKQKLLPAIFGKENKYGSPTFSLVLTASLVQLFLFSLLFTDRAYNFAYSLCTAAIIICYIFVALYQIKLSWQERTVRGNWKQLLFGVFALLFQCIGIYMAGLQYVLLCLIAYIPGLFFFAQARRERGATHWLTRNEWLVTALLAAGAVLGIFLLVTGRIAA